MEVIWKLLETCIIPIITYGSELWNPNKKETKMAESILDNIIKRILMVPTSTPREVLYMETGLKDVQYRMKESRISMKCRLEKTKNETINSILELDESNAWNKITTALMTELNLPQLLPTYTKGKAKRILKNALSTNLSNRLNETGQGKSKVNYLTQNRELSHDNETPVYINKMNRMETSRIFKARTRMLDVKNNFRGKYTDNLCRGCRQTDETQAHILEMCPKMHENNTDTKVLNRDIFTNDVNKLKKAAINILRIEKLLSQSEAPNGATR